MEKCHSGAVDTAGLSAPEKKDTVLGGVLIGECTSDGSLGRLF